MDHLRTGFPKDVGLAVVYCNYKEREMQTPVNLLSSVLRQLYDRIPLSDGVRALYLKHTKRNTRPTLAEISEQLRTEITQFSKTFIIVDALDECPEENQHRESLFEQLQSFESMAHLMITSRPEISPTPKSVQLEIVASKEDINRYIDGRISKSSRLNGLLRRQEDRTRIKGAITQKADGMFLLAQIHMTTLATATSRKELLQLLESLSKDLDVAYEKTLERIDNQAIRDKALAWRILGWMSHSLRPMFVRELQEALATEPGATNIEEDALPDVNILASVCGGLVMFDPATNVVRLVHYTAQQYLEGLRERRFTGMQLEIARICLTSFIYWASRRRYIAEIRGSFTDCLCG